MSYTLSKTIEEGVAVTPYGRKLIRCGRNRKPMGVWTNGGRRVTKTLEGERIVTELPAGVITWGPAIIKVTATQGEVNGR